MDGLGWVWIGFLQEMEWDGRVDFGGRGEVSE